MYLPAGSESQPFFIPGPLLESAAHSGPSTPQLILPRTFSQTLPEACVVIDSRAHQIDKSQHHTLVLAKPSGKHFAVLCSQCSH